MLTVIIIEEVKLQRHIKVLFLSHERSFQDSTAVAEALERYEQIRERVYKELEIKYVTKKLLNVESKEVELLFLQGQRRCWRGSFYIRE